MSLITVWDWKTEPESPVLSVTEDVWFFDDDDSKNVVVVETEEGEDENQLNQPTTTRAEVAAKLLQDLDEWVKEEPFTDWLEEKIDLPIFEDIPPVDLRPKYKCLDTQTLLQEFEYIYGEVGLNNGALTPPQSPPLSPIYNQEPETIYVQPEPVLHELTTPEEKMPYTVENNPSLVFANPLSAIIPQKQGYLVSNVDDMMLLPHQKAFSEVPATPQPDVALELAVVDELVRTRAEDMDVSSDPWETIASSPESLMSPPETSSDDSSNCAVEYSTDPEWIPETVHSPKAPVAKRKRGKPYARPVEDKRLRKKEQNKNAATRYRQKKKQEVEVILDEEKILEDKNTDLHEKVTDIQREIKYLKGLMRDLFKAKGLIK